MNAVVPTSAAATASLMDVIERAARDPAVDIEKMERLMAMVERQQARTAEQAYSDAMNAAQGEMRAVSQDAANPQTRSKYASFAKLDAALRPIYFRHGFSLSYDTADGAPDGCIRVVCKVAHKGGHSERPHLDLPADGKGAKGGDVMTKTHATMSAVSYGRRGLLKMVFNLAEGEHDDDGNAASRQSGNITPEQEETLTALMVDNGLEILTFLKWAKIEKIADLPADQYGKAYSGIQAKIAAKKDKQP